MTSLIYLSSGDNLIEAMNRKSHPNLIGSWLINPIEARANRQLTLFMEVSIFYLGTQKLRIDLTGKT